MDDYSHRIADPKEEKRELPELFLDGEVGCVSLQQTKNQTPYIVASPEQRYEPFLLTDIQQAYLIGRSGTFGLGKVSTHLYMEIESVDLDISRLNVALQKMIERQDMLRAVIMPDGKQQVLQEVPLYIIKVMDLCNKPLQEVESTLKTTRRSMSHQVMPSDQWPIFEIRASRLNDRKFRLHLSLDALIMDGRGRAIFFYEWSEFYQNPEVRLPAIELSFRDYVMAQIALKKLTGIRTIWCIGKTVCCHCPWDLTYPWQSILRPW